MNLKKFFHVAPQLPMLCAPKKNLKLLIVTAMFFLPTAYATDQLGPQLELETIKISAGMHLITAQVAMTPEQRQTGLMLRKEMRQQDGMIFVFEQPAKQCFWMKNTLLPLTVAFVADDGRIVNLADMKPQSLNAHCSDEPVRYVLEMNQGWFAKKGVKAGTKLISDVFQRNR